MLQRTLNRPVNLLGQSMPMAALVLIVFVVGGSALLALFSRTGVPGLQAAALFPGLVLRGQVWRLVTWAFFETDGQNLVFGALMLGVFGRDLAARWGGVTYLGICVGVGLAAGIATTLVAFVWTDVAARAYLSVWPLVDALIVAWALLFPNRAILFMFVMPTAGRNLMYLTFGMTALFAIMSGVSHFVPHFAAMGAMYAYVRGGPLLAAQARVNELLRPRRDRRGLRGVDGGRGPNGSGWVH